MLIKSRSTHDCLESEVTDHSLYLQRRRFMEVSARGLGLAAIAPSLFLSACSDAATGDGQDLESSQSIQPPEELTPYKDVIGYNNFYEFGLGKSDPAKYATDFKVKPWTVKVEGAVEKAGTYDLEDLLKGIQQEERIYRLRCVEAWSMVIPWYGFALADLINKLKPTSAAKYVQFETLYDPVQMPGQKGRALDWPYVEGLRLDEAMHPLAFMATGLYGKDLLGQNGAPFRLVVPWKYGFKSIKSIATIRFTETEPATSWNIANPREYGFYANVNPKVNHPRWSQRKERRIGEFRKRETLAFNGYGDQVASLYQGMDLKRYF
ncbi:MAG: protein-methionine-sulfoxide reductase catalytic subunit MsrP [Proteobacteria bacterium]|nr:protein-methionine-sulfoxide reductase catalytic subunit MsrP [Pseudomonadota bacterium]